MVEVGANRGKHEGEEDGATSLAAVVGIRERWCRAGGTGK